MIPHSIKLGRYAESKIGIQGEKMNKAGGERQIAKNVS